MDNIVNKTDANGNITNYAYDSLHRLSSVTNPSDASIGEYIINYTYDELSNIVRQEDNLGK